jgi:hypothetical protein
VHQVRKPGTSGTPDPQFQAVSAYPGALRRPIRDSNEPALRVAGETPKASQIHAEAWSGNAAKQDAIRLLRRVREKMSGFVRLVRLAQQAEEK